MSDKVKTATGAAHFWFFDEVDGKPIVDWQASIQNTSDGSANYSYDCLPMVYDGNVGTKKRVINKNSSDYFEIRPEQQLNEATVSVERETLDLNSQFSSRPIDYSRTGLMANVSISLADITLKNLAKAFGEELTESGDSQKLSLSDQASEKIPTFGMLIIPHPFKFFGDSSDTNDLDSGSPVFGKNTSDPNQAIEWRNSWIYLPSASIVEANPNLVYGIEQQQEIQINVMGLPDLRYDRSLPFSDPNVVEGEVDYSKDAEQGDYERVILGYPKYKQFGSEHDPDA